MAKKKLKKIGKILLPFLPWAVFITKIWVGILTVLVLYNIIFIGRIFLNVFVSDIDISSLAPLSAKKVLESKFTTPTKITLSIEDQKIHIDPASFDLSYDPEATAYTAYNLFRTGNLLHDVASRVSSIWQKRNLGMRMNYSEEKLKETVSVVAGQIAIEPVYPDVRYENQKIVVNPGLSGTEIDIQKLKIDILYSLSSGKEKEIKVETKLVDPTLTPKDAEIIRERAEKFIGKKINLTHEFQIISVSEKDIFSFLAKNGYDQKNLIKFIGNVKKEVERNPQNPTFVFEEGRVKEFAPAKPGVRIIEHELINTLTEKLTELEQSENKEVAIVIPTILTDPDITTDKVNNLGIKELISRGESHFRGSIPSRVFNVNLAATRLSGVLVKPGEIFSFNQSVGDISKLTGFKEAYVIKDGKTVLGDGGGVCQVSTTLFRAVLNAGLPIIERRAHAYRVGYYEQDSKPGLDATIYSPTTDFKFLNDTDKHILIQAYPDIKNYTLVFELYGTKDEREVTITKPIVTGVTPPPEDLFVDDPTLPAGQIKQIEHKAMGAKSVFNYIVKKNGQVLQEKTFVSNYRPWQAVYLRGVGPIQ